MSEENAQLVEENPSAGTIAGAMNILSQYARTCGGCGGTGLVNGPQVFGPDTRMTCPVCNGAKEVQMDFAVLQAVGMGEIRECGECHKDAWCVVIPEADFEDAPEALCAPCWNKMFHEEQVK